MSSDSRLRWNICAILLYGAVCELILVWPPLPHENVVSAGEGATVIGLFVACALCLGHPPWFWLGRRRHAPGEVPRQHSDQWTPVFLGLAAFSFAVVTLLEMITGSTNPAESGSSWLNAGFVIIYVLVLAAIIAVPRRSLSAAARARITLDSFIIMAALATFSWYFLIGPAFLQDDQTLLTKFIGTAFPVGDLFLAFCLIGLWLVAGEPEMDRVIVLCGMGLGGVMVADSIQDYQLLHSPYVISRAVDALRPLGYLIGGLGARSLRQLPISVERMSTSTGVEQAARFSLWRALAPYAFIPIVFLLVAYMLFVDRSPADHQLEPGVFAGAVMLSTLVVVRQILAILENTELNRQLATNVDILQRLHRSEHEARAEAEGAVRVRERMLAAASHDLRTPLTLIMGYLERVTTRLARNGELDPVWLTAQLATIGRAADRMLATVEDITDAAQLQAHHDLVLCCETVDIDKLLRSVTAMFDDAGTGPGLPIMITVADELRVECDPVRMERVMQNIIGNALKYTLSDMPVSVAAYTDGTWVVMEVSDRGVGIPSAEIPNIFTHFYRASTARGIPGTGIGLAGSKQIVEQHGGSIEMMSRLGHGTTVRVRLPRVMQHNDQGADTLPSLGTTSAFTSTL